MIELEPDRGGVLRMWDAPSVHVGILGGTGPAGRGLALRLAAAGHQVTVGSRDAERASSVVAELVGAWPNAKLAITGAANEEAATAEVVVVATPWDSAVVTVRALAEPLAGTVVISMVNALAKEGREMLPLVPPRGSMAAAIQAALPQSKVAASFHHLPAADMLDLESGLVSDVLVCSDYAEATKQTMELVDDIKGLRAIDAGSLSQAAAIEAFTAVCVTLNIRHRAHSTLKLAGI
jgi:NADPH-dependent F420 reductase